MAGQNAGADSELNRFLESLLDSVLNDFLLENNQADVQPDQAANGHALAGVPHQPMVIDLQQPAMQQPAMQAPPMINPQYPQLAPAMPGHHPKRLDESQATMGDSSSAVPLQQQDMLAQGDPSQAVMTHQQMLVNAPAAYGGPHNNNIPMPSQGGGEGHQFFAAMDGDFCLSAFRNEGEEEEHLGSVNVSSIPRLGNQSVPEDVAYIMERMRNNGGKVKEVNYLLVGEAAMGSSTILAPPAPAHPVVNNDPSRAMETAEGLLGIHGVPPEDERENTRRYVRAAVKDIEEEVRKAYPLLKKLSRKKKNSDRPAYLGFIYQRIMKINGTIQKREEESRRHVGSRFSRIRSEVDMYLNEKRQLYAKFRDLTPKESNCHDLLPPRRKDDEAGPSGGSGAAGAAMA